MLRHMGDMLKLIWWVVIGLFRSRASLDAEIMALRHQLNVLRRKSPKRLAFSNFDRLIFASLYRIAPNVLNALVIVKPETVIRWHRAGFRLFWRWRSRSRGGRRHVSIALAWTRAHKEPPRRLSWLIDWAAYAPRAAFQDGRFYVEMAEKLTDRADIVVSLQQRPRE